MTTAPLKTFISAVQSTQDDLLTLKWARKRLFSVISVFAVILGFGGGGEGVPGMMNRDATVSSSDAPDSSEAVS